MALCNTVQIKYRGETLVCIDPSEVKAVEPFLYNPKKPQNVLNRLRDFTSEYVFGKNSKTNQVPPEAITKIMFKDGTWVRVKIPFYEFVNAYC